MRRVLCPLAGRVLCWPRVDESAQGSGDSSGEPVHCTRCTRCTPTSARCWRPSSAKQVTAAPTPRRVEPPGRDSSAPRQMGGPVWLSRACRRHCSQGGRSGWLTPVPGFAWCTSDGGRTRVPHADTRRRAPGPGGAASAAHATGGVGLGAPVSAGARSVLQCPARSAMTHAALHPATPCIQSRQQVMDVSDMHDAHSLMEHPATHPDAMLSESATLQCSTQVPPRHWPEGRSRLRSRLSCIRSASGPPEALRRGLYEVRTPNAAEMAEAVAEQPEAGKQARQKCSQ